MYIFFYCCFCFGLSINNVFFSSSFQKTLFLIQWAHITEIYFIFIICNLTSWFVSHFFFRRFKNKSRPSLNSINSSICERLTMIFRSYRKGHNMAQHIENLTFFLFWFQCTIYSICNWLFYFVIAFFFFSFVWA